MPDHSKQYEAKLRELQNKATAQIRKAYEDAILEISLKAVSVVKLNDPVKSARVFRIKDYPTLMQTIDKVLKELHSTIYATIVNSIEDSWSLSNSKNNALVDKRLLGKSINVNKIGIYYDPNAGALKSFLKRKEKGLNLSGRVWKQLDNYKIEMEQALGVGISEGKPAAKLASELKQYLNEPDKLFRRVRNAKGELKLSSAAKNYHPGKGIYRSSYKNALRLTATETNLSYRSSDHERWKTLPFVKGIEVKLSNNHPIFDQCDHLKGLYQKDFKFTGWHPLCRCMAIPVLATDAEFEQMEDALLNGTEPPKINEVTTIPKKARDWIKSNSERIASWKSQPYFIRDNQKHLKNFFNY